MDCPEIKEYIFSDHARFELHRRGISEEDVRRVLKAPQQCSFVRPGRCVYQSKISMSQPAKEYVLRVFVDVDRPVAEVVTIYRTSKIEKYWR